jgi:hypothetical protein
MVVVSIGLFLLLWPVQWIHYGVIALPALVLLLVDRRTWLAVAAAFILFQVYWNLAWLPAAALLLIAGLRPDLTGRVQAALWTGLHRVARTTTVTATPASDDVRG